ncbi:MAG TPA: rhodanese-like domain-containing protein [Draconibacterium sp.]|nr:rhodanese-like domain-containing protein [Draconibacterium sp.]
MRILSLFSILLVVLFVSCSGGGNQSKKSEIQTSVQSKTNSIQINDEAKKLLAYLEENGDYVKGRNFPSLIKTSEVYNELDSNNYIIDLRNPELFAKGHIKGAHRVKFTELPDYFQKEINPSDYDKIVLVSYAGQISSYATSLLRLMGYNNVYSMKWGMSSWDKNFAVNSWLDVVSDEYENQLDSTNHTPAPEGDLPKMNTGKTTGKEIAQARFKKVFEDGVSVAMVSAEEVFEHPENYYVINYDRKDKYESGHIPGAIRYRPHVTLGYVPEMQTIPADKKVVVYCNTGQNSGFVAAYLRLLGYDAKTLMYGNNSFMHHKMLEEKNTLSWVPFTSSEIDDYPYVKN